MGAHTHAARGGSNGVAADHRVQRSLRSSRFTPALVLVPLRAGAFAASAPRSCAGLRRASPRVRHASRSSSIRFEARDALAWARSSAALLVASHFGGIPRPLLGCPSVISPELEPREDVMDAMLRECPDIGDLPGETNFSDDDEFKNSAAIAFLSGISPEPRSDRDCGLGSVRPPPSSMRSMNSGKLIVMLLRRAPSFRLT